MRCRAAGAAAVSPLPPGRYPWVRVAVRPAPRRSPAKQLASAIPWSLAAVRDYKGQEYAFRTGRHAPAAAGQPLVTATAGYR
jgi:hypothetical protein